MDLNTKIWSCGVIVVVPFARAIFFLTYKGEDISMDKFYRFGQATFDHPALEGTPRHIVNQFAQTFLNIEPSTIPSEGFNIHTYAPKTSLGVLEVTSEGCREAYEEHQEAGDSMITCHTWIEVDFEVNGGWVELAYGGREPERTARISWERTDDHFELTDFYGAKIGFTKDRLWEIISDLDRAKAIVSERLFQQYMKSMRNGEFDVLMELAKKRSNDAYLEAQARKLIARENLPPLK